jgi:hypothetical protein
MEFSKVQQEFQIRYYLWAISEWEKEINESFPNLRSFKSGSAWKTYQFMRLLEKSEQLLLAHGLLKRFHADAVKSLGESCSSEEENLRRARDGFFDIRQKYQFVQQLQKEGQFDVAGFWIQQLRGEAANVPGVAFFNDDTSPTKIHHERHPEITAPALRMAICISFSSWLGITSQIQWEHIFNEDVEAACDAVIKHCRHFFEVAPKLLKGLEFENITAN